MMSKAIGNLAGNGEVALCTDETNRDSNMHRCKSAQKRFKADEIRTKWRCRKVSKSGAADAKL